MKPGRRVPQIFQMEAVECGAAALAMILAHHQKWVPLEHVRQSCGVSRDGSDAHKMALAAKQYGLRVKALQRETDQLDALPLPAILYWEFNHFVVLTEVQNGTFHINDPATGPRALSQEEFSRGFTGLTLCFAPGPEFEASGKPPSLMQSFRQRLTSVADGVTELLVLNLLLTVPVLLAAGLARIFLDDYLLRDQSSWLWAILLAMGVGSALAFALSLMQQRLLLRLQNRLAILGSVDYVWRLMRLPFLFFTQRSAGELVQRIRLNSKVANTLAGPAAQILLGLLNTILFLILMAFYDWLVALASALTVLAIVSGFGWLSRQAQVRHQHLQLLNGRAYGVAVNGLQNFETYYAQGAVPQLQARWLGAEANAIAAQQSSGWFDGVLRVAPIFARGLLATLILVLSAERAMSGDISFGSLLSLQLLAGLLIQPMAQLMTMNAEIQESAGAMLRLDDLANYPEETVEDEGVPQDQKILGHIEVNELSYAYQHSEPVLRSAQFTLQPGVITAIVGASGSGKSTLAKLLVGLLKPDAGEILLDGQPLQSWPASQRQIAIAYVEQTNRLMQGDLFENLSLWQESISHQQVIEASRQALIHEVISAKPGGYEVPVSAQHHPFSGGEVQRLCLARALARNPAVLVLDEATSALDTEAERQVMQSLSASNMTVILVTHRPSTLSWCDNALVLENGEIVQAGSARELLSEPGPMQRLMKTDND